VSALRAISERYRVGQVGPPVLVAVVCFWALSLPTFLDKAGLAAVARGPAAGQRPGPPWGQRLPEGGHLWKPADRQMAG
jgi:hypothetical protein